MSDTTEIVRSIISGVVTGTVSATTTLLTVFQKLRNRVKNLEDNLGSSVDPKTGLNLVVASLDDAFRRLKRDIDGWEDHPPDWAKRLIQRAKLNASSDLNTVVDIESRVDARLRSFQERLTTLEKTDSQGPTVMTREEYLEDSQQRAEELSKIREEIAATNGLLKGVLVALGRDPEIR